MRPYQFASFIFLIAQVLQCIALNYDPSKTYTYTYESDIIVNDVRSKPSSKHQKDIGIKLNAEFQLSSVFKNSEVHLFKLQITKAEVSSPARPSVLRTIGGSLFDSVYFEFAGDRVGNLRFSSGDSTYSRNVKKGIIALFQVQETEGERTEVDVSGECQVKYTVPQAGTVERVKTACQNLEIANQFSNTNKALGVSVYSHSTQVYRLKDSVIDSVRGSQQINTYPNIRQALNGEVMSSQNIQLQSVTDGPTQVSSFDEAVSAIERDFGSTPLLSLLPSEEEVQQCTQGCEPPKTLVAKLKDDLLADKLASVKSAKAFIQILKSFRSSGKKSIAESLTSSEAYYIVPQLIDIATATQTEAGREVMLELLDFTTDDAIEHPQRFLFAAAYSSHPSTSLISDLLAVLNKPIPSDSLRESLLLSLGAIVHTYCQIPDQCTDKVVEEFTSIVVNGLSACKEEPCRLMYLRAMGNAGLHNTLTVIIPFLESPKSTMLSNTAISALRRIDSHHMDQQVTSSLMRIFNQNKASYDSTVRGVALDVLLEKMPTIQIVRNALLACLDQTHPEFSSYLLRYMMDFEKHSPLVRDYIVKVLSDTRVNNYNIFSQKGKSSFVTNFLAKMTDVNASYDLYNENADSGVMKQSGMVVNLVGKNMRQPFMKFGIYADGLESLVGGEEGGETAEDAAEDDDESESAEGPEPTAGMSFTFMDVLLTQVEFFRGTSGLMSAVWNAPSELTSALQGNLLLQDHSQRVHLSNGFVLDTRVLGVLSMDLSGYVSISLWNRNCDSLIRNSGALYVEGMMAINSHYFDLGITFSGEGESNIDFTGNADFYTMPLKLCTQMKRPDITFTQIVKKYEAIKKTKRYVSKSTSTYKMSGESYFLNKANSEECRLMFQE